MLEALLSCPYTRGTKHNSLALAQYLRYDSLVTYKSAQSTLTMMYLTGKLSLLTSSYTQEPNNFTSSILIFKALT